LQLRNSERYVRSLFANRQQYSRTAWVNDPLTAVADWLNKGVASKSKGNWPCKSDR
jgi:hypothetical protein